MSNTKLTRVLECGHKASALRSRLLGACTLALTLVLNFIWLIAFRNIVGLLFLYNTFHYLQLAVVLNSVNYLSDS